MDKTLCNLFQFHVFFNWNHLIKYILTPNDFLNPSQDSCVSIEKTLKIREDLQVKELQNSST